METRLIWKLQNLTDDWVDLGTGDAATVGGHGRAAQPQRHRVRDQNGPNVQPPEGHNRFWIKKEKEKAKVFLSLLFYLSLSVNSPW